MNEFKKSLEVKKSNEMSINVERKNSGEIIISDPFKNLLVKLMQGEISKKDVMRITEIGDKATVERKIEEVVILNPKLEPLYEEYINGKSKDFDGYNFRPEVIEMLRGDYSQSAMAEKIGVNRRSFSTKVKKLQEANKDNILGALLTQHAERKMKRQKITNEELIRINLKLDQYEEEFPIGLNRYGNRTVQDVRIENIQRVLDLVEGLTASGMTVKEISEQGIISESTYRKYKKALKNSKSIANGRGKEEE